MYRSVSNSRVESFWICDCMTSVFDPSDAVFLIFYTENQFLHHRQLLFPYKSQLLISIKEAVYICCVKPLHRCENVKPRSLWQCLLLFPPELFLHCRIGLLFKMMVVMTSKTTGLPEVLDGCENWYRLFVEGHKLQESERMLRITLVAWLLASVAK